MPVTVLGDEAPLQADHPNRRARPAGGARDGAVGPVQHNLVEPVGACHGAVRFPDCAGDDVAQERVVIELLRVVVW